METESNVGTQETTAPKPAFGAECSFMNPSLDVIDIAGSAHLILQRFMSNGKDPDILIIFFIFNLSLTYIDIKKLFSTFALQVQNSTFTKSLSCFNENTRFLDVCSLQLLITKSLCPRW